MDKYETHLEFVKQAFPQETAAHCTHVFIDITKKDIRKAIFHLVKPQADVVELEANFCATSSFTSDVEQLQILEQLLHHYCPNTGYSEVVGQAQKGLPFKLDTATLGKLKKFRRAPRISNLKSWLDAVDLSDTSVLVALLQGLRPFGRELQPLWARIDAYANADLPEVVRAALELLACMPTGIRQSLYTFGKYCRGGTHRFFALYQMQRANNLPTGQLRNILSPVIKEYQQLLAVKGSPNLLSEEFRLVQSIARQNGLTLSSPSIRLNRF